MKDIVAAVVAVLALAACAPPAVLPPASPPQYTVGPAYFDAIPEQTVYGSKENHPICASSSCTKPYSNATAIVAQVLVGTTVEQKLSCRCYYEAPKQVDEALPTPPPAKTAGDAPRGGNITIDHTTIGNGTGDTTIKGGDGTAKPAAKGTK